MARIRRYNGPIIAEFDGKAFREYCGPYVYEVEEFLGCRDMMAQLAILA